MPFFHSAGVRLHYDMQGNGMPVVLLHGLASSVEQNWRRPGIVDALVRSGLCVVALDSRGHGRSEKPYDSAAYSGIVMGDDAIRLMDHLGLEQADLAGYSMGGSIAASLLARYPDRFRRAIIAGAGDAVLGPDAGIPRRVPRRGRMSGRDLTALAAIRSADRAPIDADSLAAVTSPVLILLGSGDRVAGNAKRLAAAIPGASVVRVPGNHFSAVANPAFREAMVKFLCS